jgi:hypothetical protein
MAHWLLTETGKWLLGAFGETFLGGLGKRILGRTGKWFLLVTFALMLLTLLGTCRSGSRNTDQTLGYTSPVEISIARGEMLPGTDIQYIGRSDEGAQVLIGGQPALKKAGDSLNWKGNPVDGVAADLNLRVVLITEDKLHVAGTAEIAITDPEPQPGPANESAPIHYKLPVAHRVKKGAAIPGTPFIYAGKTDQGALLGNMEGYPYREIGDSIAWQAQLKEHVWLELNLRTGPFSDRTISVAGTADLWIAP